jgi:cbb3-type cytochrome oxidase maturation protein
MAILFLLIGISLSVAVIFLGGFLWASRSGQYDDTYTPSVRMLFDDEPEVAPTLKDALYPEKAADLANAAALSQRSMKDALPTI